MFGMFSKLKKNWLCITLNFILEKNKYYLDDAFILILIFKGNISYQWLLMVRTSLPELLQN